MGDRCTREAETLAKALRRHYGIDAVSVQPVRGGEDPSARAYRVEPDRASSSYFVKVREANGSRGVAAAVSRYLLDAGLPHVLAPIRSNAGTLTVQDGGLSFTVYPFVEGGRTGVEAGLVERHWLELGRQIRRLHASVLPSELARRLATETYRPALDVVRQIDRAVSGGDGAGRIAREVAGFWTDHRAEILALVERTAALAPLVERLALPHVLCHADLHTWNVMIDGAGELWLIDWDEVIQAPKERDLMFVVGGIGAGLVEPHETAWFLEGYGDTTVDPLALSYYRHAWAVQDIAGYGERVFLDASLGDEDRAHAARIMISLFGPGEIVDLARGPDEPSAR